VLYRASQFWRALTAAPAAGALAQARQTLSAPQMALFLNLQTSEQVHSLNVLMKLYAQGERSTDLLSAALLHDVGKSRYVLRLWERIAAVIGRAAARRRAEIWGQGEPHGWKRPFVVASQHALWGARMAEAAGASPLTVELVRRHHDPPGERHSSEADGLLRKLQLVDHNS